MQFIERRSSNKKKFNNNMMYTHYTQYTLTCAGRLFDVFRITHVDIIFFFFTNNFG